MKAQDRDQLVQTTVFTLFGDQYDTRVERQLLLMFQHLLKREFDTASEQGTIMRANTAVTKMLSA